MRLALVSIASILICTSGNLARATSHRTVLNGRHLIAAVSEHPPHVYSEHYENRTVRFRGGSHVEALRTASEALNFTFDMVDIGFNEWDYGTYNPETDTWTGTIAKILGPNPEADFMLHCPYDQQFNFLPKAWPMSTSDLVFFTRPGFKVLTWYSIFRPFDWMIWVLFVIQLVFLGLIQAMQTRVYNERKRSHKAEVFHAAIFRPLSLTLEQQDPCRDKHHGFRLTTFLILLGSLVLGAAYRGDLRQKLMFPKEEPRPQTFLELLEMPDFSVTLTIMGGIEQKLFENPNTQVLKDLKARLVFARNWFPCFMDAFGSDKNVCIVWSAVIDKGSWEADQSKKLVDPIYQSNEALYSVYNSWAFPPGSNLVAPLKWATSAIYEAGLFSRWDRNVTITFKQKQRDLFRERKPDMYAKLEANLMQQTVQAKQQLKFKNVWIAFAMMGICLGLAGIVFLIEIALRACAKLNETKVHKMSILF